MKSFTTVAQKKITQIILKTNQIMLSFHKRRKSLTQNLDLRTLDLKNLVQKLRPKSTAHCLYGWSYQIFFKNSLLVPF